MIITLDNFSFLLNWWFVFYPLQGCRCSLMASFWTEFARKAELFPVCLGGVRKRRGNELGIVRLEFVLLVSTTFDCRHCPIVLLNILDHSFVLHSFLFAHFLHVTECANWAECEILVVLALQLISFPLGIIIFYVSKSLTKHRFDIIILESVLHPFRWRTTFI